MDLTMQDATRKLVRDVREIQARFEMLERDRSNWRRRREEDDLDEVMEYLKKLETDVSILESDCVLSMTGDPGGREAGQVFDTLNDIFGRLNNLFEDVKTMKTELKDSYIQPGDLDRLRIDWGRFRKTIGPIEEHL